MSVPCTLSIGNPPYRIRFTRSLLETSMPVTIASVFYRLIADSPVLSCFEQIIDHMNARSFTSENRQTLPILAASSSALTLVYIEVDACSSLALSGPSKCVANYITDGRKPK